MRNMLPRLYLISDRHQIPAGREFLEVLEELLTAGVKMIQLREKDLPTNQLYPLAVKVRELTAHYDALLLINDRIDIALAVGADGVHLGHHSLPASVARKILGPKALIGVSTHSLEQLSVAEAAKANFATFGPVYHTPSKAAYGDPVGIKKLQIACSQTKLPVYALGGIKAENAAVPLKCGAYGVSLISALIAATDPKASWHSFEQIIQENEL